MTIPQILSPYDDVRSRFYDDDYDETVSLRHISKQAYLDLVGVPPRVGGAALDLCAGTGWLTAELASLGWRVTALDVSHSMLALLKKRIDTLAYEARQRVDIICENAARFELVNQRFQIITCAFNALNFVASREAQQSTLNNVFKHLEDDGIFIFDIVNPLRLPIAGRSQPDLAYSKLRTDGTVVQRYDLASSVDDKHFQCVHGWYDEIGLDGQVKRTLYNWVWRLIDRFELEYMLRDAGFRNIQVSGVDFNQPLNSSPQGYLIVARKK